MNYGVHPPVEGPFDAAVLRVTDALKKEGFGVLSDIDIRSAMKDKLQVDMPAYRILGACNPPLAHAALQAEPEIGLLLPCNVTIRQGAGNAVHVGFLNPDMMVELTDNPGVADVAKEASARLHRVCDALNSGAAA